MQVTLPLAALVLSGCFAHGHSGYHHRSDAVDAILTTAVIVADIAQAAQSAPEAEPEPLPPPPDRVTQADIDARRAMLDHIADEAVEHARAGRCADALRSARFLAQIDRGYFEAYLRGDPDVDRCAGQRM